MGLYTIRTQARPEPGELTRLTPKQLAAHENVHYNTVLRWIACGGLPHYRGARHGAIFIRYGEFLAWARGGGAANATAEEQHHGDA